MMSIVTCKNCGKSEGLILTIDWKYEEKICNKCNNIESSNIQYDFCSYKCMMKWLKKANDCITKNKHIWKSHIDTKQYKELIKPHKTKKYTIQEYCQICGQTRYVEKIIS